MEKSVQEKQADGPRLSFTGKAIQLACYPVALISGFLVACNQLHQATYDALKNVPGNPHFKDIKRKHDGVFAENARAYNAHEITATEMLHRDLGNKRIYSQAIGDKMGELGYGTGWMRAKNVDHKWHAVSRTNQFRAVIEGMTVVGIALGATLSITNSQIFSDLFSDNGRDRSA